MMKSVPALLLLEWEGKGAGGKSARFVLKILHDGGRGLVELGFYENLAAHAEGPGAQGKVRRGVAVVRWCGGVVRWCVALQCGAVRCSTLRYGVVWRFCGWRCGTVGYTGGLA